MITALIFDMDGVLIDSEPVHKSVEQQLYQKLGLQISYEEHMSMVGMSSKNTWALLKKKYGFQPSVAEMVALKKKMYRKILVETHQIALIKNVKPVLSRLAQRYTLALASSSSLDNITTVIDKYELKPYFKVHTSGQEVSYSKPSPDIFLLTAQRLDVLPRHCLVIEDACNGIRAAKLAGMSCIGFQNSNSGIQDLTQADVVVNNYLDLEAKILECFQNPANSI